MTIADGIYEEIVDDSSTIATALVAGAAPLYPPKTWFENPGLSRPTPLTVTEDGQIYGHIATWNTNHIGLPTGTRPPQSRSDYAFFKTGSVRTEEGEDVFVGQLTLAGGHAPLNASAAEAAAHYDNTQSAVADVTAGEDQHGIYITGGLRPGVGEEQIRALRASAPSGDWRPINGALELVAICQVNTPGFPVARTMVASGQITALVAAGASYMYGLQQEAGVLDSIDGLRDRIANLESVVAGGVRPRKVPTDPAQDNLVVRDQGAAKIASNGQGLNDGISRSEAYQGTDITVGYTDDSVRVDTDSPIEVVEKKGLNKATSTQSYDALQIGAGTKGVGDDADGAAGLRAQEAAACAACGHSEEINGVKQIKGSKKKNLVAGGQHLDPAAFKKLVKGTDADEDDDDLEDEDLLDDEEDFVEDEEDAYEEAVEEAVERAGGEKRTRKPAPKRLVASGKKRPAFLDEIEDDEDEDEDEDEDVTVSKDPNTEKGDDAPKDAEDSYEAAKKARLRARFASNKH